ncbi:hypothetical protein BOW53_10705 [Solemya pervernicosa gill symbiont]|uniref:Uncharacterized protein n=1 Tax=Solemya pervernicosa gill symbiont TaxID=642797 RepID=A0A1T2L3T8_9GAMM|nr:hypothetical protein BOW53_10705 [Solemya pervernicosa gill symbiont]
MVILVLLGVLITVATDRIWTLRMSAERVGVEHLIASLKSALAARMTSIVVKEGAMGWARLDRVNPMSLLGNDPDAGIVAGKLPWNYIGERDTLTPTEIPVHRWYFDRQQRMLVYRVLFDEAFESTLTGPKRIRLQLLLDYEDDNRNGSHDAGERVRAISLQVLDRYRWLESEKS